MGKDNGNICNGEVIDINKIGKSLSQAAGVDRSFKSNATDHILYYTHHELDDHGHDTRVWLTKEKTDRQLDGRSETRVSERRWNWSR